MEKFNGLGKLIIAALLSIGGTVAVGYMTLANKHITRSEASVMIQKESPYNADKNLILHELEALGEGQRTMSDTMQRLLENSRASK